MYVYKRIVINESEKLEKGKGKALAHNIGSELKNATSSDVGVRAAAGAALGGLGNMAVGTIKHRVDLRHLKRSGASDATIAAYKRLAHRDTIRRGVGGAVKGAAVGAASHYAPAIVKGVKRTRGFANVPLEDVNDDLAAARNRQDDNSEVNEAISPEAKAGLIYAGLGAAASKAGRMYNRHSAKKSLMKQYDSMNLTKKQREAIKKRIDDAMKAHRRKDLANMAVSGLAAGGSAYSGAVIGQYLSNNGKKKGGS